MRHLARHLTVAAALLALHATSVDAASAGGDLLRDVAAAIDAGDGARVDAIVSSIADDPAVPEVVFRAIDAGDTDLILFGADVLDASDFELYELASAAIELEQAEVPEAGADGPPIGPPPGQDDPIVQADRRGLVALEHLQFRDLEVPDSAVVVLGLLPRPGSGATPPRPVDYEAARREIRDIVDALAPSNAVVPVVEGDDSSGAVPLVAGMLAVIVVAGGSIWFVRHRRLMTLAATDALTGLKNRRQLDADVDAPSRRGTAALMIDVDHFKNFNDEHGHEMGDDVLRRVADAIAAGVRDGDVPYRYGGEEFCVLLADTDTTTALVVAERVRAEIESVVLPDGLRVTASVGVAAGASLLATDALRHADAALYEAKQAGRNRVVVFPVDGVAPEFVTTAS